MVLILIDPDKNWSQEHKFITWTAYHSNRKTKLQSQQIGALLIPIKKVMIRMIGAF